MAQDTSKFPTHIKFLFAGIAGGGATAVCYPLDVCKIYMQTSGEMIHSKHVSFYDTLKTIYFQHGVKGFYYGLTASILRQIVYTGGRIGAFQAFTDYFTHDGKQPNFFITTMCGLVSAPIGALLGLPIDVALTKSAVYVREPTGAPRKYYSVFHALYVIHRDDGWKALTAGAGPTVVRAMFVNVSQLVSYQKAKEFILAYNLMDDAPPCHVVVAVFSALVSTIVTLPPDIAKTRMQNMKTAKEGEKAMYTNMVDVWLKIVGNEGILALWKGFLPLFLRNGPQNTILFLIYEQLVHFYRKTV